MLKRLLVFAVIALSLIFIPQTKLCATSDTPEYEWSKLNEYITGRDIYSIAYNGKSFVAVGQKGLVIKSDDGLAWSRQQFGYEEDLYVVEWDGAKFITTSKSNRKFIQDDKDNWSLLEESNGTTSSEISYKEIDSIASCKIFGIAEGKDITIAVGESGNIFVGCRNKKIPIDKITFSEYPSYYKEYLKRLGNSTILHIGNTSLYSNNNLSEKSIPAPLVKTINKQRLVYVPAEEIVRTIGGKVIFESKTSTLDISIDKNLLKLTLDKNSAVLNGTKINISNLAAIKNGQAYISTDLLKLMGIKSILCDNLVILSEYTDILNVDEDKEVLDALQMIFTAKKYQSKSLSESTIKALIEIGRQQLIKHDLKDCENYLQAAIDIERNSEVYANLIKLKEQELSPYNDYESYNYTLIFNKARDYFQSGLNYNCENPELYRQIAYIYCKSNWFDKAEECLKQAMLLAPKLDFSQVTKSINEGKGALAPVKVINVKNLKELVKAIGSNRKINVLPGDYSSKPGIVITGITSVKNLTISGVPGKGSKYIDLKDAEDLFRFVNCYNVELNNLVLNSSFDAGNSSSFIIKNCRILQGLHIANVYNLSCFGSYIEGLNDDGSYKEYIVRINSSEKVTFDGCTMKGYTLVVGDTYDEYIADINILNSILLNRAGICSTYSKYVPIKDDCGYEINFGTEGWNEWRFLAGIKYTQNYNWSGVYYENTYDGNEAIFNDGQFLKLAEKLDKITNGTAFPSVDYIIGDNEEWNAYYDFYGTPKSKKLNIIYHVKDLLNENMEELSRLIMQLKPIKKEILDYGCPITVVLTDSENPFWTVAVAEFTTDGFDKFLTTGDSVNLERYSTIMLSDETEIKVSEFFSTEVKSSEVDVSKFIEQKLLTDSLSIKTNDDYGQQNSVIYSIRNNKGIFYITAVESFTGQGDFMHYNTDLIIRSNAITNEHYICTSKTTYKLAEESIQKVNVKYKDTIFNQLQKDKNLSKKLMGSPCKDVLMFIENDKMDKELKFVFLTAVKNKDVDLYSDSEYSYCYMIGTFNLTSQKVTSIENIDLVDYENMLTQN